MKIAFIGQKGIFGHSGGGVESHVEDLALNLAREGHEVLVYTRPYYCRLKVDKTRKYKGVTLIELPTIRTKHLDAITHTFFASVDVLRRKADIIHYHSIGPASLIWIPKLLGRKTRVVFTYHSMDYYHQKWGKFARMYLRLGEWVGCHLADEVIAISRSIKKHVYERYGVQSTFIPNGVKKAEIIPTNLISKLGLKNGNYILCVARMIPHKNIHLLVGAYQRLWDAKKTRKKLVVVGGGTYTDLYVKYLTHYSKKSNNIIFTGQIPNSSKLLKELYSNAYLYVHPSESEGLSISLLEAGSFGVPILASDIIENQDVLADNGFYFKNKSLRDLENRLYYLLKHKGVLPPKTQSLKTVIDNVYNWKDLAKDITNVYLTAHKKPHVRALFKKMFSAKGH